MEYTTHDGKLLKSEPNKLVECVSETNASEGSYVSLESKFNQSLKRLEILEITREVIKNEMKYILRELSETEVAEYLENLKNEAQADNNQQIV